METVQVQLRKWGRSMGLVIPKATIEKGKFREGEEVEILVIKKSNALRETFGKLKLKRTTEQIMKEIREESWDE